MTTPVPAADTGREPQAAAAHAPMTGRKPQSWAVVSLALAFLCGTGTVLFTYGMLAEYGTTTGSWRQGALDGMRFAWPGLVLTGALTAIAFLRSRGSRALRLLVLTTVVLTAGGAAAAGATAAIVKYDRLPRVAYCLDDEMIGGPAEPLVHEYQSAYDQMDHPARFGGGGSTGVDGCSTSLLDVTFAQAAGHYRQELPSLGWEITRDDRSGLQARRGELNFLLGQGSEPNLVSISIQSTRSEKCDGLQDRDWENCMFDT